MRTLWPSLATRGYASRMSSPDSDIDPTPEALEAEFPGWHVFYGVSQLWYARKPLTSPPVLLRAENLTELRVRMKAKAEELADPWHGRR